MSATKAQPRRAALGSFIGTTIEWYDFYIYGFAAALVFAPLFFTGTSTYIGTLSAFGTFAVGFFARPVGGLLFGHLGDRLGRKNILVTTLIMMGIATILIGMLPTYATIGIWAPILLVVLRLFQGIAVGGEWGGAVLLAAEHAPKGRKTFFAAFAQLGSPGGLILALLAFRIAGQVDQDVFLSWGWRIPFLFSFVLLIVGLVIRLNIEETPEFEKTKRDGDLPKLPMAEIFRDWRAPIFLAMGANVYGIAAVYFYNTFLIAYATQYAGLSRSFILEALFWTAFAQFASQLVGAKLAEKIGNEKLFLQICSGIMILTPYMVFASLDTGHYWLILAALFINVLFGSSYYAVSAGYISQIFPARVRYSAISIGYQFCGAIVGGMTPLIGTILAEESGGAWWPLAIFAGLMAGTSLICVTLIARYRQENS